MYSPAKRKNRMQLSGISPDHWKNAADGAAVTVGLLGLFDIIQEATTILAFLWLVIRVAIGLLEFRSKWRTDKRERRNEELDED